MKYSDHRLARTACGVAFAALAGLSGNASAIVISNPSFENVAIGFPFNSSNVADVPGWTRSGAAGDAALWRVGYSDGGGNVTVAGSGQQFTTMGGGFQGQAGSTTWSQTVGGFVVGATYRLDFQMSAECVIGTAPSGCSTQSLTAAIDQVTDVSQLYTATNNLGSYWKDWEDESLTFTADSASVGLSFTANVPYDVGLDNVRILCTRGCPAVPEPASLALLGLGLAGLGFSRRRKA